MGKKVKVVLDTNVWISILFNKVVAKDFVPLIEKRKITIYLSHELLEELARALTYPRVQVIFERAGVDPKVALSNIVKSSRIMETERFVEAMEEDPADNRVLECALTARVEYIVNGDRHLLALGEFKGIKILRVRDFSRSSKEQPVLRQGRLRRVPTATRSSTGRKRKGGEGRNKATSGTCARAISV